MNRKFFLLSLTILLFFISGCASVQSDMVSCRNYGEGLDSQLMSSFSPVFAAGIPQPDTEVFTWSDFQKLSKVKEICIPNTWKDPELRYVWENENESGGQQVAYNLESGFMIYSVYDFEIGAEYNTYASREDYVRLQNNEISPTLGKNLGASKDASGKYLASHRLITVDDKKAIETVLFSDHYGSSLRKMVVIPEQDSYLAFDFLLPIQAIGQDGRDDKEGLQIFLKAYYSIVDGNIDDQVLNESLKEIDTLINKLEFEDV